MREKKFDCFYVARPHDRMQRRTPVWTLRVDVDAHLEKLAECGMESVARQLRSLEKHAPALQSLLQTDGKGEAEKADGSRVARLCRQESGALELGLTGGSDGRLDVGEQHSERIQLFHLDGTHQHREEERVVDAEGGVWGEDGVHVESEPE